MVFFETFWHGLRPSRVFGIFVIEEVVISHAVNCIVDKVYETSGALSLVYELRLKVKGGQPLEVVAVVHNDLYVKAKLG